MDSLSLPGLVADHVVVMQLANGAAHLDRAGLRTSIYNIPLCLLAPRARKFAIQSISDWKREYWPECEGCSLKAECGGAFFSSRGRLMSEIVPQRNSIQK